MLARYGNKVDVLLGARGKSQLANVQTWKRLGYEEIESIHFVTLEDYYSLRLANPNNAHAIPKGPRLWHNGLVRLVEQKRTVANDNGEALAASSELYLAGNGFPYMRIDYSATDNVRREERVLLFNEYTGTESAFNSVAALRRRFFVDYVNELADQTVIVMNDVPLSLESGYRDYSRSEQRTIIIACPHDSCFDEPIGDIPQPKRIIKGNLKQLGKKLHGIIVKSDDERNMLASCGSPLDCIHVLPSTDGSLPDLEATMDKAEKPYRLRKAICRKKVLEEYHSNYAIQWSGLLCEIAQKEAMLAVHSPRGR